MNYHKTIDSFCIPCFTVRYGQNLGGLFHNGIQSYKVDHCYETPFTTRKDARMELIVINLHLVTVDEHLCGKMSITIELAMINR